MNKFKKISIITIILYLFFINVSFASEAIINVSAARLREEANTTSNVLTNIYKGEKVEIVEKQGDWYKVKYGKNTGYLKKDLLKEVEGTSNTVDNNVSTYEDNNQENVDLNKVITISNSFIRFLPTITSNTMINIEANKELTKITEIGNWTQVTDGAITGWILSSKISSDLNQEPISTPSDFENTTTDDNKDTTNTVADNDNKVADKPENKVEEVKKPEPTTPPVSNINKTGIVNVETAKVRETPSKTAKTLGFLDYNDKITIVAEEGEWYKFKSNEISGYVFKTLVDIEEENVSSRGTTEERKENIDTTTIDNTANQVVSDALSNNSETQNAGKGQDVANLAKQYLGYPYVVWGKTPESGFDCSGFTRYIFMQFGYSLGATAASQNNIGTDVNVENLKIGDLILFYDDAKTKIGHTGIYIGNDEFVHSANPKRGVVIDNIKTNTYYKERFITAKRIVE